MTKKINRIVSRREFLKLVSLLPIATLGVKQLNKRTKIGTEHPETTNVIILVFDTLSALHISLYGYHRETMPNLAKFAEKATVFNAHYSTASFTTPGTSSILTGTYPWTNRGIRPFGTVLDKYISRNIFSAFDDSTRIAFSHNYLANILLHQFNEHLNRYVLPREISLIENELSDDLFLKDYRLATRSEKAFLKPAPDQLPNSLFLSLLSEILQRFDERQVKSQIGELFPRGIPKSHYDLVFVLEDAIDLIMDQLISLPQPFLAYYHMLPPHDPYNTRQDFMNIFHDRWTPIAKPGHFFSQGTPENVMVNQRRFYDEYIAYADAEFGRLVDFMEKEGVLKNTWVVFTSDHGEMFERGILNHITPTLYEPVIRVPLLISEPHQKTRQDVYTATSSIDLLPTLLHVTGHSIPDWCEGRILPPYSQNEIETERSIFSFDAKANPKFGRLSKVTASIVKGEHKLIHYFGYEDFDNQFELYDLKNDPEELNDLYASAKDVGESLKNELLMKLKEVTKPIQDP